MDVQKYTSVLSAAHLYYRELPFTLMVLLSRGFPSRTLHAAERSSKAFVCLQVSLRHSVYFTITVFVHGVYLEHV